MKKHIILILFSMLCTIPAAEAQVRQDAGLHSEIMKLDSLLFNEGFNKCKLKIFDKYIDNELEFFHDTGGTQNRAEFLQAVKRNICSNPEGKPMRTLVAGTTQIFPLNSNGELYGAVQHGVHRFHAKGSNPAIDGYTIAKFTNIWLLRDGRWTLKSAISYDHRQMMEKANAPSRLGNTPMQAVRIIQLSIATLSLSIYFQIKH